jgi:glucokinase
MRAVVSNSMKSKHNVLAVDLGGTKCSAAMIDRRGHIVHGVTQAVDLSSPSAPVVQIRKLAEDLAKPGKPKDVFAATGIAVPGLVRAGGTVWAPNLPGWSRMPLAKRLQRSLELLITVESDRNCAVLGECWRGAARGKSDVVVVMIGTGIGAGILSGGRLLRGAHELSGCAGWLTITGDEMPGSATIGELESLVGGPAIALAARKRLQLGETSILSKYEVSQLTSHEVADAARQGDRVAMEIFQRVGRLLGFGIANIVSLFDPQIVVLGGGIGRLSDLYLQCLRSAMLERAQPLSARQVRIVSTKLGDKANLLGCARLAWESVGVRT